VFDDLLRQLQTIPEQQLISVEVPLDDDGYFDRRCPADECGATFKVQFQDWKDKVPNGRAWCAICREVAEPSEFNAPDQQRYFAEQAKTHLLGQLDDAIRRAHKPTVKAGFITMSWSYQPGLRPLIVPSAAEPVMTQFSECEQCACHFASIGAAFFCPACGYNSARSTFVSALATVRGTMDLADRMGELIGDRDQASDTARQLAENALVRIWSSFQRYAEAAYASHPAGVAAPPRRNAFQSLPESNALWQAAIGKSYTDFLSAPDEADLVRLVQARHVLAHRDGLVDTDYVARSGDHRYSVDQRLVVSSRDVGRLADIAENLQRALAAELP
jgi:hypothetical protein